MDTKTDIAPIVAYIKEFLLYGNKEESLRIGYEADEAAWENYAVVVVPNGYLGKGLILPDMGRPEVEKKGKTWVVKTDIIYNTFFFISRAEEVLNHKRDEHGRFLAQYSILGHSNRLQIPIVDEYAHILLKLLEIGSPKPQYSHIYLTHDVDTIAQYRHLRGWVGGMVRGEWKEAMAARKEITNDPNYTFPWIIEEDKTVNKAQKIYFIKYTKGKGKDYPQYALNGKDYKQLESLLLEEGAQLGLHSSYYGWSKEQGDFAHQLAKKNGNDDKVLHRSHYLCCSIERMQAIADAGVTDDFTMGFADQAGFRLQTCRAVRWINPVSYTLTNLVLHPLTVMDCTLSNSNYMNLQTEDEAYFLCEQLFDKTRQHAGDICLLWHNSIFRKEDGANYHASLYNKLLKGLRHYSK